MASEENSVSEVLGTLAELRGFLTQKERGALGDPVRPRTTDDPVHDLFNDSAAALDRDAESDRLRLLYGLRIEVVCHCFAALNDDEIQTLSDRTSIPTGELAAARTLAHDVLVAGREERVRSLTTLLEQLDPIDGNAERDFNDLLVEVRKLGHWPGNSEDQHVRAYRDALGHAVLRHARFAVWAARQTVASPSPPLLLAALDGVREALERFDPHRGFRLSTYATGWVRQRVMRAITNYGAAVRAPVYFWEDRNRLLRAMYAHVAMYGTPPDRVELEKKTSGLSERVRLAKVLRYGLVPLRDVWSCSCEGAATAADQLFLSDPRTDREMLIDEGISVVEESVESLEDRLRQIIRRRFGLGEEGETLEAIGLDYNISRERVRQLQNKALETLNRSVGGQLAQVVHAGELA